VANRQRRIGFARELLASAQALIDRNYEASVRKSLAAASAFRRARVAPPRSLEDVLRKGLLGLRLRAELRGGGPVRVTRFSPNGSILLVAGAGGARLFDLAHGFALRRLRRSLNLPTRRSVTTGGSSPLEGAAAITRCTSGM